ncbi:hypothetical protein YC2023_043536 [Brassica napus]
MCTMLGLILVLDERESRSLKPHEHLITHWSYATVYHSVPDNHATTLGGQASLGSDPLQLRESEDNRRPLITLKSHSHDSSTRVWGLSP